MIGGVVVPKDITWPVRVDGEWSELTSDSVFGEKRVLVFALPGAFTPTCSNYQLPAFDELHAEIKELGIDEIYCLSVNDTFVMNAWADSLGVENVKMIPDGSAQFTHAMGRLVAKDNLGFGVRSWRYAMIVDNFQVEAMFVEEGQGHQAESDPYEESTPEKVVEYLMKGRNLQVDLSDTTDVKERFGS